jgi:hypothetical protein
MAPQEIQECDLWQGHMCGVMAIASRRRSIGLWPIFFAQKRSSTTFFLKNTINDIFRKYQRLTSKVFIKKLSLPKLQECDYGKKTHVDKK